MIIRPINTTPVTQHADLSAAAAKQPAKTSTAKKIAIATFGTALLAGAAAATYAYKRDAIEKKFPGSMSGMEAKVSQAQAKITEGLDKIAKDYPQFGPVRSTIAELPNKLPSKDEINAFVNPFIEKAGEVVAEAGKFSSEVLKKVNNFVSGPSVEQPHEEAPVPCIDLLQLAASNNSFTNSNSTNSTN